MDALPTELLLAVIELILIDQPTLSACSQLNRRWHSLTRQHLYRQPRLHTMRALEAFVKTVDKRHSIPRSGGASRKNSTMVAASSISPFASSSSSSSPAATSLPISSPLSAISSQSSPGELVQFIDLSMLPHRWETVDIGHIQSIVYGCPFIASLDLSNCTLLRDNAIQMIAEQLGSRCLTSLVLSGCVRITDLAVLSICAYAVRLENLELSECDRISDSSVLELGSATVVAPRVRNQEDMDEEEKDEENENASTIVLGVSRTIKSLDLSHCTRITDTGIKGLRMGATQLSSLNLEGCYGVLAGNEGLDDNEWEDFDDMDEAFITAGTEIHAIEES